MANEPLILARQTALPAAAGSEDYRLFSEVLGASERGRAFLDEHARRSRGADHERLMAALARIEMLLRGKLGGEAERLRAELRKLLAVIGRARPNLATDAAPARAAKFAVLLDLLESRLAALAAPAGADSGPQDARLHLTVVPPSEEPELPIPSPLAAQPALPALAAPASGLHAVAEVTWFDGPPPGVSDFDEKPPRPVAPSMAAKVAALSRPATTAPAPAPDEEALWQLSDAKLAPPPPDPLAALMALSEDERIALFT